MSFVAERMASSDDGVAGGFTHRRWHHCGVAMAVMKVQKCGNNACVIDASGVMHWCISNAVMGAPITGRNIIVILLRTEGRGF